MGVHGKSRLTPQNMQFFWERVGISIHENQHNILCRVCRPAPIRLKMADCTHEMHSGFKYDPIIAHKKPLITMFSHGTTFSR